jgi:hypothetical protein
MFGHCTELPAPGICPVAPELPVLPVLPVLPDVDWLEDDDGVVVELFVAACAAIP